jgi:hypothetical protein
MKYDAPDKTRQASLHLAMIHAVRFLALCLSSDLQTATLGFSGLVCTHLTGSYRSEHLLATLKKENQKPGHLITFQRWSGLENELCTP